MITLGLDIGTTRTKALVYETNERRVLGSVSETTPVRAAPDGDQRDPEAVWRLVGRLCRRLAADGAPIDQVEGISAAAVGEEIVFVDELGRAMGPVSCWYVDHSEAAVGVPDTPAHALASWYAIRDAARRGDPTLTSASGFTDLGSWMLMRLADRPDPVMDRTHASRTGLIDRETGDWSVERLKSAGIDSLPPKLVDSGELIGVVSPAAAVEFGVPVGARVHAGAHDHLCAALAVGVDAPGEVFLSIGTSESQLMVVDTPWASVAATERPDLEVGHFIDGRFRYLHAARPSGRRVAELVAADPGAREVGEVFAALLGVLENPPEASAPLRLRADAAAVDATAAALFCELEHQAVEAARLTAVLEEAAGRRARRILITGRPVEHKVWRRIRQAAVDRPVEFLAPSEPSAVGAAILASSLSRTEPVA